MDGLAFGALPDLAQAQGQRLRLLPLVHHPLALESGLTPARAETLRRCETRALAQARLVLVTSKSTAALLMGYEIPAERVRVVEPGTDPAPAAKGSGSGPIRLLCVAALSPRKGHDLLLIALSGLNDIPWQLDCVGSLDRNPVWAESMIQMSERLGIAGRVRFLGAIGDQELERRYAQSDIFVLPSRFEGYGMVFAEALAHGLPILAARAGAVGEVVPPDAGILVPPEDPVALRLALSKLLIDSALRRRLAAGAWAAGQRLPTWPQAIRAFSAACEEALDG